jgi:hypothetical protein
MVPEYFFSQTITVASALTGMIGGSVALNGSEICR